MSNPRLKVVVLFGGQSGEHEVSLKSAQSVISALDPNRYEVYTIGISKTGQWYWGVAPEDWMGEGINKTFPQVTLVHDPENPHFIALDHSELPYGGKFDFIFPVLHGPFGEDGTVQGLLELANIPYAGSGVLGSSLGMDKDRMKAAFIQAGLTVGPYICILRSEFRNSPDKVIEEVKTSLGFPCFVKPANLGSSVGISKANNEQELLEAIKTATLYDRKIIIEQNIKGREIELSVLGNDRPQASIPGEILPAHEFYDYEAKYHNSDSRLIIPAPFKPETVARLQEQAIKAFVAVNAAGLARVDFFVTEDDTIYINEINTMPGFTSISMYPKLWEASGLPYNQLVDQLIELGLERHRDSRDRKLVR